MLFLVFLLFANSVFGHFQNKFPYNKVGREIDPKNDQKTQVLIIGAGISGLEIARLLNQNNIKTINLEARDRIGGRIWSVKSQNGYIFDMGAAWIHGVNGSVANGLISNPLWELTKEANIETLGTLQIDHTVFYADENFMPRRNYNLETLYTEYLEYVFIKIKNETTIIKSLDDYAMEFSNLKNFSFHEKNAFLSFLHFAIESYEGTELNLLGAKSFYELTSVHYGEEHVFQKTGYKSIIEYLAKKNNNILLNKIVKKIDYSDNVVKVETTNGEIYEAPHVVVTVPLGILKAEKIEFQPQLPQWKKDSINRLGFGVLDKIVLIWNKAWWNSTNYYFIRASDKPTSYSYWVNVNKWNDKPALVCYFVGKEAERIESLDKEAATKEALQALKSMFPNYSIPEPIEAIASYWKKDPFSNGSYSYVSKYQNYNDPLYLSLPVDNKLLFAGEATSTDSYGYAHGALQSARREATRLMFILNLLDEKQNIPRNSSFSTFKNINYRLGLFLFYSFILFFKTIF